MEVFLAYHIHSTDEVLMALLTQQYGFEAIEEHDGFFIAYIPRQNVNDDERVAIEQVIQRFAAAFSVETIPTQNWNALWEAEFQPVLVDDFCQVRADFHPAKNGMAHDLIINPKMAFGTGHHATTYMMIKQMSFLDFDQKLVLDFGCGTGILAILASKLGAQDIDAIDIEKEAIENTKENAIINSVYNLNVAEGSLEVVSDRKYNIILANINRNILTKYVHNLLERLHANGYILMSGILREDAEAVKQIYQESGATLIDSNFLDNWACLLFRHQG